MDIDEIASAISLECALLMVDQKRIPDEYVHRRIFERVVYARVFTETARLQNAALGLSAVDMAERIGALHVAAAVRADGAGERIWSLVRARFEKTGFVHADRAWWPPQGPGHL
jgi:hypothetical protein